MDFYCPGCACRRRWNWEPPAALPCNDPDRLFRSRRLPIRLPVPPRELGAYFRSRLWSGMMHRSLPPPWRQAPRGRNFSASLRNGSRPPGWQPECAPAPWPRGEKIKTNPIEAGSSLKERREKDLQKAAEMCWEFEVGTKRAFDPWLSF